MGFGQPKSLTQCRRFFVEARTPKQRAYEALRAYFVEARPSHEVARAFGYSPGAFRVMCHQFRRERAPVFFVTPRRGPRTQPKKSAARDTIIALRKRNYSVYEISEALKERHLALSPTAVREVLKAEGFAALPRRLDEERPTRPRPTVEPVADARAFALAPRRFLTRCGGLFLFVPALVRLDLDEVGKAARLPGSKMIPAGHALRSALALKLWSIERKSHIMALVADEGLALFAGLNAIPKRSYLAEYSSRIDHAMTTKLLAAWQQPAEGAHLFAGRSFNLDFHSVPYYGEHPVIERHYVSMRSRRQKSVLIPRSAWRTVELEVPTRKYRFPRVFEQRVELVKGHTFRQMFIEDLGHEDATILLTNDRRGAAAVITRYAQRMLIENALSDAVRFFHLDALSSAVGLKVDFDMALLVIASGLYRLLARRMRGYAEAHARRIFQDLVDMPAQVQLTQPEVRVEFHRRAHLPIVLASGLCDRAVTIPWWEGRKLRLTTYTGR